MKFSLATALQDGQAAVLTGVRGLLALEKTRWRRSRRGGGENVTRVETFPG
ncbi:hypothetical protein LOC72_04140 [Roseiconus lacunae]|nr:hypothetical protein [Roseiconus lacunae]